MQFTVNAKRLGRCFPNLVSDTWVLLRVSPERTPHFVDDIIILCSFSDTIYFFSIGGAGIVVFCLCDTDIKYKYINRVAITPTVSVDFIYYINHKK